MYLVDEEEECRQGLGTVSGLLLCEVYNMQNVGMRKENSRVVFCIIVLLT